MEDETLLQRAYRLLTPASYLLRLLLSKTSSTVSELKVCPHVTWSHSREHTLLDKPDVSPLGIVSTTEATLTALSPCLRRGAALQPLAPATTMQPLLTSALLEDLTSVTTSGFSTTWVCLRQIKSSSTVAPPTRWS